MNSTVFAVAVISSVAGAIFGVLVKHILDIRGWNQVCRWYVEEAEKVDERDKVIRDLQDEINRLHTALAVKSLKNVSNKVVFVPKELLPEPNMAIVTDKKFFDMNDLHSNFGDDVDFGGKF